jgi:cell division protein FtsQ
MDPRIRTRRRAVARHQGRRRLLLLVAAGVLVALLVAGWFALHSSLFSAKAVTVTGEVHTPRSAVIDAAGLSHHPPLIDLNTGAAAAAIERLPWVASAQVSRHWPDGVRIAVRERTPVALAPVPHSYALVDATGRVLANGTGVPPTLPVIVETGMAVPAPGRDLPATVAPAMAVARSLPVAFKAQVSQVVVARDGLHLVLTTPVTVFLGSATDLHAKYEDTAAILAGAALHNGDVIDVSAPGSPVVTGP